MLEHEKPAGPNVETEFITDLAGAGGARIFSGFGNSA